MEENGEDVGVLEVDKVSVYTMFCFELVFMVGKIIFMIYEWCFL